MRRVRAKPTVSRAQRRHQLEKGGTQMYASAKHYTATHLEKGVTR